MVSGTRQYTTESGEVEIVHVLERVDVGPMIDQVLTKARTEHRARPEGKVSPAEDTAVRVRRGPPATWRTYTVERGRFSDSENDKFYNDPPDDKHGPIREWRFMNTQTKMTGAFVALDWPTARLKTSDGETIRVVVSQLPRSDQAYIHHLAK